ncbi:ABC transporter permease [Kocuria coralli]|uniref:ABC transporter permease n=1 Tax=Kocuria coralli TaxID=1461025 RepID=A0A5J5KYA8_9MICC|nr:ABC transporter permease [Kocuria coralli]KAA9394659.1 ABC transporter permease [Kocuria coralli]
MTTPTTDTPTVNAAEDLETDGPRWIGSALQPVLAIIAALLLGGVLIAATDERVMRATGYFFSRPTDTFAAAWRAASSAYEAMFYGAVFNPSGDTFTRQIYPLTETLTVATPLIFAGLGVAIAFRAGLFNIGAQGQILIGATLAAYVGFAWSMPLPLHLLLVIVAGVIGGGIWGGFVGLLKARTGAHEVIVTIMLNYIAANLLAYLLTRPAFLREGSTNPLSPPVAETAQFPLLLGPPFRLHWGFLLAIAATVFMWWVLNRSTIGFEIRAVGSNPRAAKTAGINVTKGFVVVMVMAGGFAGLAGVAQISGTEGSLSAGVAASFGFDAITVALLGRSTPLGTFLAGLLYGGFRAGAVTMQTMTGTNVDIVLVVQSLIVLFIALPPLFSAARRKRSSGAKGAAPSPSASAEGATSDGTSADAADTAQEGTGAEGPASTTPGGTKEARA